MSNRKLYNLIYLIFYVLYISVHWIVIKKYEKNLKKNNIMEQSLVCKNEK